MKITSRSARPRWGGGGLGSLESKDSHDVKGLGQRSDVIVETGYRNKENEELKDGLECISK